MSNDEEEVKIDSTETNEAIPVANKPEEEIVNNPKDGIIENWK